MLQRIRKISLFFSLITLASMFIVLETATAEPWLATRYAENCAGCHAPSRYNLPPKDRRCTLSCQGCHTNPNGGGMRNFYGKWNSDRWLRSNNWKKHGKKKEKPLPWFAQHYISEKQANQAIDALSSWGIKRAKAVKKKAAKKKAKKSKKKRKPQSVAKYDPKTIPKSKKQRKALIKAIKSGKRFRDKTGRFVFTESDYKSVKFSEWYFERANADINWVPEAKTRKKFESTIPYNDPYFQKKREELLVGLDMRYYGSVPLDSEDDNADTDLWPMALDIGMQYKPFINKYDNVSLVVETRYANGPSNTSVDYITTSRTFNRSTYVLVDDAIFNSFFMYGVYKPMFEHYTPDHTTLAQNIMYDGLGFKAQNKAITIGLAPNVPFFNFTMVQPQANKTLSQEEGYIANLGARWVTLGASLIFSYKSVINKASTPPDLNTTAYSLSGGLRWKDFVFNAETLNITKEFAPGSADSGSVMTGEVRYRIWKESYIEAITEVANVTANFPGSEELKAGDATQLSVGYKIFPVSGMEFSIHYRTTNNKPKSGTEYKLSQALLQAHLYF